MERFVRICKLMNNGYISRGGGGMAVTGGDPRLQQRRL